MSKKVMTLTVFLGILAGSGIATVVDFGEKPYYCLDTNLVCVGSISDSGKTCYFVEDDGTSKMKRCLAEPYWQNYDNEEPDPEIEIPVAVKMSADNREWECEVKDGRIGIYTRCHSGDREAYLGEKI